jgi:hypothetical protein
MSTTARKLRKRNGLKFVHPSKVATPIYERIENQPAPHSNGHGGTAMGLTGRARKRLSEAAERLLEERAASDDTASEPQLDPKPWRVGRKRYATGQEALQDHPGDRDNVVFSPRKDYSPAPSDYGIVG